LWIYFAVLYRLIDSVEFTLKLLKVKKDVVTI
jgi:hypothetical protein